VSIAICLFSGRSNKFSNSISEKRKDPPDADTKPSSSSIEGTTSKGSAAKRQRR
jgi:hypothetical protein